MKKLALAGLTALIVAGLALEAIAQGGSRGTSSISLHGKTVSVEYGRPGLNGRTTDALLGRLQPGELWRLGSNTSTTFKTEVDLAFGDVTVPAGTYSIWMQRQSDNSWKLLFDKKHGQWGSPAPPASEAFASAPLTQSAASSPVETLTLTLHKQGGGGDLVIQWGTLEVTANFTAK